MAKYLTPGDLYARTKPGQSLTPGEVQQLRQQLTNRPTNTAQLPLLTVDPVALGLPAGDTFVRVEAQAGGSSIQGMAGGTAGRQVIIRNVGSIDLVFAHENANAAAENRLSLGGVSLALAATRAAHFVYDALASRWVLVSNT